MKYKIVYILLILSIFFNIICFYSKYAGSPSEKYVVGYYEVLNTDIGYSFFKDNKLIIKNKDSYRELSYNKIGFNTYLFNDYGQNNLFFWNGENFIIYNEKLDTIVTLEKKSNQTAEFPYLRKIN